MIQLDLGVGEAARPSYRIPPGCRRARLAPGPLAKSFDVPAAKPSDAGEMPHVQTQTKFTADAIAAYTCGTADFVKTKTSKTSCNVTFKPALA